jgi:hypothetical protein
VFFVILPVKFQQSKNARSGCAAGCFLVPVERIELPTFGLQTGESGGVVIRNIAKCDQQPTVEARRAARHREPALLVANGFAAWLQAVLLHRAAGAV